MQFGNRSLDTFHALYIVSGDTSPKIATKLMITPDQELYRVLLIFSGALNPTVCIIKPIFLFHCLNPLSMWLFQSSLKEIFTDFVAIHKVMKFN